MTDPASCPPRLLPPGAQLPRQVCLRPAGGRRPAERHPAQPRRSIAPTPLWRGMEWRGPNAPDAIAPAPDGPRPTIPVPRASAICPLHRVQPAPVARARIPQARSPRPGGSAPARQASPLLARRIPGKRRGPASGVHRTADPARPPCRKKARPIPRSALNPAGRTDHRAEEIRRRCLCLPVPYPGAVGTSPPRSPDRRVRAAPPRPPRRSPARRICRVATAPTPLLILVQEPSGGGAPRRRGGQRAPRHLLAAQAAP
jgi:hypothetical protein